MSEWYTDWHVTFWARTWVAPRRRVLRVGARDKGQHTHHTLRASCSLCLARLSMMEEQEIWEMAAGWIERDLGTMRRGRTLVLAEEEADER